jgi:hypothetical protein
MKYILNGWGDLASDPTIRKYIGKAVELVKICNSGLFQIKTSDDKLFSVRKGNLDDPDDMRMARIDAFANRLQGKDPLEGWTFEVANDLKGVHGIDLEEELVKAMTAEIVAGMAAESK